MYSVSIALQLAFLKYIRIYSVVVLKLIFPFLWFFYLFNICASILLFCTSICVGRCIHVYMWACRGLACFSSDTEPPSWTWLTIRQGVQLPSSSALRLQAQTTIMAFFFHVGGGYQTQDSMLTPTDLQRTHLQAAPSSRNLMPAGLPGHLHTHNAHKLTQAHAHIRINKK